jgi:hypothetical protein
MAVRDIFKVIKCHLAPNLVFEGPTSCDALLLLIFKLLLKFAKIIANLNQVFTFITLPFMTFQGYVAFLIVSGALSLSILFLDDIADSRHAF